MLDNEEINENSVEIAVNASLKDIGTESSQILQETIEGEISQAQRQLNIQRQLNNELKKEVEIKELIDNAGNIRLSKDPIEYLPKLKKNKKLLYSPGEWQEMIQREDVLPLGKKTHITGHTTDDGMLFISQHGSIVDGINLSKLKGFPYLSSSGWGYKNGELTGQQLLKVINDLSRYFKLIEEGKTKSAQTGNYSDSVNTFQAAFKRIEDSYRRTIAIVNEFIKGLDNPSLENADYAEKTFITEQQAALDYGRGTAYKTRLESHRNDVLSVNVINSALESRAKELSSLNVDNNRSASQDIVSNLRNEIEQTLLRYKENIKKMNYTSAYFESMSEQIDSAIRETRSETNIDNLKRSLAISIQKERLFSPDIVEKRKELENEMAGMAFENYQANIGKIENNTKEDIAYYNELKEENRRHISELKEKLKALSTPENLDNIISEVNDRYQVENAAISNVSKGISETEKIIQDENKNVSKTTPVITQIYDAATAIASGLQAIENQVTVAKQFTGQFKQVVRPRPYLDTLDSNSRYLANLLQNGDPTNTYSYEDMLSMVTERVGFPYTKLQEGYWNINSNRATGVLYKIENDSQITSAVETMRTVLGESIRDSIKNQITAYSEYIKRYAGTLFNSESYIPDGILRIEDQTDRIVNQRIIPVSKAYSNIAEKYFLQKDSFNDNYWLNLRADFKAVDEELSNFADALNKTSKDIYDNMTGPAWADYITRENEYKEAILERSIKGRNPGYAQERDEIKAPFVNGNIDRAMDEVSQLIEQLKYNAKYLSIKENRFGSLSLDELENLLKIQDLISTEKNPDTGDEVVKNKSYQELLDARQNVMDAARNYLLDKSDTNARQDLSQTISVFSKLYDEMLPTLKELAKNSSKIVRKNQRESSGENSISKIMERRGMMYTTGTSFQSLGYMQIANKWGLSATGGVGTAITILTRAIKLLDYMIKKDLSSFSQIQSLQVRLGTIYGDQSAADDAFDYIKAYAKKSPFGVQAVTEMAVQLKQSGIYSVDLLDTLKMIGDVSGDNAEKMKRVANNYAQVVANGRATTRDLREFANAGIPIFRALQEVKNTTLTDIYSLTQQGEIKFSDIQAAFKVMTENGGTFENAVEKNSKTYLARKQNLEDQKQIARAERGEYAYTSPMLRGILTRAVLEFKEDLWSIRELTYKNENEKNALKSENATNNETSKEFESLLKKRSKLDEVKDKNQIKFIDNRLKELNSNYQYDVEYKDAYKKFSQVKDIIEYNLSDIAKTLEDAKKMDEGTYSDLPGYKKSLYESNKVMANMYMANLTAKTFDQVMDKWKNEENSLFTFSTNSKNAYETSEEGKREKEFRDKAIWDESYKKLERFKTYVTKTGEFTTEFSNSLDDLSEMFQTGFLLPKKSIKLTYETLANNTKVLENLKRSDIDEYNSLLEENNNNWNTIKDNFKIFAGLDYENEDIVNGINKLGSFLNNEEGNTKNNVFAFIESYNKFSKALSKMAAKGDEEAKKLEQILPGLFEVFDAVSGGTSWNSVNGNKIDLRKRFIQSSLGIDDDILKYRPTLTQQELMSQYIQKSQKQNIRKLTRAILDSNIDTSYSARMFEYNKVYSIDGGMTNDSRRKDAKNYLTTVNQDIIELNKEISGLGLKIMDYSMDLLNRPQIDTTILKNNGWYDVEDGIATVYSSTYTNSAVGDGSKAALMSPISQDGTKILSPAELENRADMLFMGLEDKNNLEFKRLFVEEIAPFLITITEGVNAIEEADRLGEKIHLAQDTYYNQPYSSIITSSLKQNAFGSAELNWARTEKNLEDFALSLESGVSVTQAFINQRKTEKDTLNDFISSLSTYTLSSGDIFDIKNNEQLGSIANNLESMGINVFQNIFDTTSDGTLLIKESALDFAYALRESITQTERLQKSFANLKVNISQVNDLVIDRQGELYVKNNMGSDGLFAQLGLDKDHAQDFANRVFSSIEAERETLKVSERRELQGETQDLVDYFLHAALSGNVSAINEYNSMSNMYGYIAGLGNSFTWQDYNGFLNNSKNRDEMHIFRSEEDFVKNRDTGYFKTQSEIYKNAYNLYEGVINLLLSEQALQQMDNALDKDQVLPLWKRILSNTLNVDPELWKNNGIKNGADAVNIFYKTQQKETIKNVMGAMLDKYSLETTLYGKSGNRIAYLGAQGNIDNNSEDGTKNIDWKTTYKNFADFATSLESASEVTLAYADSLGQTRDSLKELITSSITMMEDAANIYDENYQQVLQEYAGKIEALDANAFDLMFTRDEATGMLKFKENAMKAAEGLYQFTTAMEKSTRMLAELKEDIKNGSIDVDNKILERDIKSGVYAQNKYLSFGGINNSQYLEGIQNILNKFAQNDKYKEILGNKSGAELYAYYAANGKLDLKNPYRYESLEKINTEIGLYENRLSELESQKKDEYKKPDAINSGLGNLTEKEYAVNLMQNIATIRDNISKGLTPLSIGQYTADEIDIYKKYLAKFYDNQVQSNFENWKGGDGSKTLIDFLRLLIEQDRAALGLEQSVYNKDLENWNRQEAQNNVISGKQKDIRNQINNANNTKTGIIENNEHYNSIEGVKNDLEVAFEELLKIEKNKFLSSMGADNAPSWYKFYSLQNPDEYYSRKSLWGDGEKTSGNTIGQQAIVSAMGLDGQLFKDIVRAQFSDIDKDGNFNGLSKTQLNALFSGIGRRKGYTDEKLASYIDESVSNIEKKFSDNEEEAFELLDKLYLKEAQIVYGTENIRNSFIDLGETIKNTFKSDMIDGFNKTMTTLGSNIYLYNKGLLKSGEGAKNLRDVWKEVGINMLQTIGPAMTEAGFSLVSAGARNNNFAEIAAGIGLVAAGGVTSMMGGFFDAANNKDKDDETEKLERLKDLLKDIIDQAKTDANYYEQNMRHNNAISLQSVNDMILTPHGNFSTAPDDYIIATKNPQSLGNSGTVINFKIEDHSTDGNKVQIRQERKQNPDGSVDIVAYVVATVGEKIANGDMDGYFAAQQQRLNGNSYAG